MKKKIVWLKIAFIVGIIVDALAIIPMLYPPMAKFMWGIGQTNGIYCFAMGYGAALMAGWTLLLVWAYRKPIERRFMALLTLVVIAGFVITEIIAVTTGTLPIKKILPSWIIQAILIVLFSYGYNIGNLIAND